MRHVLIENMHWPHSIIYLAFESDSWSVGGAAWEWGNG